MSTAVRASKNIFYKAVAEISSRLIYLVFFIYMARRLGAADFGLFSFAFSFAGIFAILVDPGLNVLLTRDVSRDRALTTTYSGNIFTIKIFLSIGALLLIWLALRTLSYDNHTMGAVLAMGLFLIINCFFDFLVALSNAHEKMELDVAIKVMNKLFISTAGIAALLAGSEILGLINWMAVGSVMALLLSLYLTKKYITFIRAKLDWQFLKTITWNALPVALTMVFATIYFKIDVVMLSMFKVSNADIGLYSAAVKLIEILNVIPAVFVGGLFPIMADFLDKSKADLETVFKRSYHILLLIAVPIVVTAAFLSKDIIRFIYGDGYGGSAGALTILIWTSLFIFPNFLLSNLIIIANKQRLNAVFAFSCLILNVLLNLFLIPRYGFVGASISTIMTDMLLFALASAFAVQYFKDSKFLTESVKPVLCGIALAVILIGLNGISLIFMLPVSLITYFALIFLTKSLTINDLHHFKRILLRT